MLTFEQRCNYIYRTCTGNKFSLFKQNITSNGGMVSTQELRNMPLLIIGNPNNKFTRYDIGIFDLLLIGVAIKVIFAVVVGICVMLNYITGGTNDKHSKIGHVALGAVAFPVCFLCGCIDIIARNIFACVATAALLPLLAIGELGISDKIESALPEGFINSNMNP